MKSLSTRFLFIVPILFYACASTEKPTVTAPSAIIEKPEVETVYKTVYVEEFVARNRGGCKKGVRCGKSCIPKGNTCRISQADRGGCKTGVQCGEACIAADKKCRLHEDIIDAALADEMSQVERVTEYKQVRAERKAHGKTCKKGCPCGNACIPCSKTCRK